MKKVLSLLTVGIVLVGFFGFSYLKAADGSVIDQSYEVMTMMGYGKIGYSGIGQTFRPTMNRISSVEVYLTNRTSDPVTMTIQNPATKEIIGTETHNLTFAGDAAWETFGFESNLVVRPDTEYVMYLSSNVDNVTRWMMSGDAPGYARGFAVIVDYAQESNDMLFRQYGKKVTEVPATPVITPPVQTTAPTTTTTASAVVQPPVLTYVMNGDKRIEAPVSEDILVSEGTGVVLYGTSTKGTKVTVTVGKVGSPAKVDADGNWEFKVDYSLLVGDSVFVSAQAQDNKDVDSTIVTWAKIKKATAPVEEVVAAAKETESPWYQNTKILMVLLAIGLVALVALGGLLYYLIKHRKPKDSPAVSEKTAQINS